MASLSDRVRAWWDYSPPNPRATLHRAGIASLLLFAAAAVCFSIPRDGWLRIVSEPARWGFIAGLLYSYAVGFRAVRALPPTAATTRLIWSYAVLLVTVAACISPFHSSDVYVYINRGWQQAEYGVNPYTVMLYETPNGLTDPMFFQVWQFNPTPYGFLFTLESRLVSELAGRDYALSIVLWKLVAAAAFLALGAVVHAGVRVFKAGSPQVGLFLYAWSPILLLHHVSNAHNDLQMVLFTAVSLLAAARGRWLFVFPTLAAAVLIKAPAGVLVPLVGLYSLKVFGWWRTLVSLAAAGALTAASAVLYWDPALGSRSDGLSQDLGEIMSSIPAMLMFVYDLARKAMPELTSYRSTAVEVVRTAFALGFVVFYAILGWRRLWARPDISQLARDAALVMTVLVLLSPKFHGWYVGMFLPLALWVPTGDRVRRVGLAIGAALMMGFTGLHQADFANALLMLVLPVIWAIQRPKQPRGEPEDQLPSVASPMSINRAAA